jgi:hypothetical protein
MQTNSYAVYTILQISIIIVTLILFPSFHPHYCVLHFVSSLIHYEEMLILYMFNLLLIVVYPAGQKFREVFQLKRGSYSDLAASKISEMMHSSSLDVSYSRILSKVIKL